MIKLEEKIYTKIWYPLYRYRFRKINYLIGKKDKNLK